MCVHRWACLYSEINWNDIMLGLSSVGLVPARSMPARGGCVVECEDGLQMAAWWRFMDEQWLCNVSVWDEREMCDVSAAASTLRQGLPPYSRFELDGSCLGILVPVCSLPFLVDSGSRKRNIPAIDYHSNENTILYVPQPHCPLWVWILLCVTMEHFFCSPGSSVSNSLPAFHLIYLLHLPFKIYCTYRKHFLYNAL